MKMDLIKSIKKHEGFKEYPYIDPVVATYPNITGISKEEMNIIKKYFDKLKVTFGIGFTFITEEEANMVLQNRIKTIKKDLYHKAEWILKQPQDIQDVLIEMAYQLGVNGLLKFKKTLSYCKQGNYDKMSEEMLNSSWAKQTPRRAKELSNVVKGVSYGIK
jgi:lysozyme